MTDHTRIIRAIQSAVTLLRESQTDDPRAAVRFSKAKYFRAILRTLPYSVHNGVMVNREYKPIGLAGYSEWVDYSEWHTAVADKEVDARLYDDARSPWSSPSDFDLYMRKLRQVLAYLEKGGDLLEAMTTIDATMPSGSKFANYREYVAAKLGELGSAPTVLIALHHVSSRTASATIHKEAGPGKVAVRPFNRHFLEVAKI